ncbi:hypothetical protein [Methylobacterium oryzae]|nr:hypothetical protein [Methylobacterium oryzae]
MGRLKLFLLILIGIPLHYAYRTRLGRPIVGHLMRALRRFA